jgi:stearoyl-CoA desaturase (delta-9 desaturase)
LKPATVEQNVPAVVSEATGPLTDVPKSLVDAPLSMAEKVTMLCAVVLPIVGLIAGIVLLWEWGITWTHLGLFIGMYTVTAMGVTVGYHRLFTHASFQTPKFMRVFFAICGSMAVQGPLLTWVAVHRKHHQHSDADDDPHSPHAFGSGVIGLLKGMWHAHVGWLFAPKPEGLTKYVKDLIQDRALLTVDRLFAIWVFGGLLIPALIGGLVTMTWTGALLGLIWGGLVRVFAVHHVTWSINSVCHVWGTRPFRSHDHSTNNLVFALLGFGEGWHNNHHAFPTSAKHGLAWWQIDMSYLFIRMLSLVGLARNVRVPAPHRIQQRLRGYDDESAEGSPASAG